nr:putative RNA-directed DNA polymerase, eukaryota, reverse transcriptase zinc-binding domain protein [Tanacetum cinerariifolium]
MKVAAMDEGAVKNDGEHKQVAEMDSKPSLVIDESCMLEYDYSLALNGKVVDFGLLTNLKTVLTKEGFESFNLKYLGGFWVLIEFCMKELLEKFKSHVGVGSWFSSLEYASNSFVIDERAVWVDIEGVPTKIWTNNTFKKIASKWGELLFEEDRKNTSLYSKRICIKTKMEQDIFETFKIIIKEKVFWIRAIEVSGWIPDFLDEDEEDEDEDESDEDFEMVPDTIFSPIQEEPKHDNKSNFEEGEIQLEDPFHIYDLLAKKPKNDNKEEESSKATLKYPLGFTPDDVLRTKDVQDVDDVVEVQENTQKSNKQDNFTKDNNVRGVTHSKEEDKESFCSGQFRKSVGPQTGGSILQVMEDLYLVISVYAPQEAFEKRMLWSYLNHMIDRWDGESILIGDFNEVRHKDKRFGSIFNNHNAMVFNSFISSSGLVEVPLGGCAFTWCHKSGSKMSKLDRFLISEGIVGFCPNITSITLDRYLSDHRPIILLEVCHDYGPIPFRMYYYWFDWDGFDRFIVGMLKDTDILIDEKKVDQELLNKRMNVINSIHDLEKLEATEIAQKAKIKWSIEGDENSIFFHGILNKKRNQHAIRGILSEGNLIEDPNSVKNALFSHFKERFDSPCSSRLMLEGEFPNKLRADQSIDLESNVTIEEIKRVVWDCGIDKSSGPDGFTFGFYRRYWDSIKKDADAVSFFFISGNFPKGGNSSFIALIPKMQDAKVVKDYKPISLIGSLYKIIAKILANRLVGGFGRKKETMIFKVDFEKAYDSVRWDYMDDVLNKFGFGPKWRNWIHNCLNSSKGSILVNGSPTGEFQFWKGLKQGDPLSSFLFLLIIKSLHLSFQNLVNEGLFKGVSVSSSLHLSHLFYADDVIFMGQWSVSNINTLVQALDCFYKASGLQMNLQKIGGSMSRIKVWDEIEAKLHSRLSKWKMKTLSSRGRLTLLKLVLGSPPIYYMSIYKVPSKVLKCLEDIRRNFFIGADVKEKKMSWLKWSRVLASKDKGGLGVSIHGNSGGIETHSRVSYSSAWLSIVNEVNKMRNKGSDEFSIASVKKFIDNSRDGVEMKQFRALSIVIDGVLLHDMVDRWKWTLEGSGEFSIASVKKFIDNSRLIGSPKKTRWIKMVPIKVNILAWKVQFDLLPTRLNLSRR